MRFRLTRHLLALLFTLVPAVSSGKTPSRAQELKVAIVPSNQSSKSIDETKSFGRCLEEQIGIRVALTVPNNYMAVVVGLGSGRIDLAVTDIMGYLLAEQDYQVIPIVRVKRFLSDHYYSMILVKKNGPKKLEDLTGKKFAYSDAISASSFILPHIAFKERGIKLGQEVAVGGMQAGIMSLLQNKVDAVGAYYFPPDSKGKIRDARDKLISMYPDIVAQTDVLWVSSKIPNEPVVARKDLDPDVIAKAKKAFSFCFKKHATLINNIDDAEPVDMVKLQEYKDFSKSVKQSGLDVGKILQQKKGRGH